MVYTTVNNVEQYLRTTFDTTTVPSLAEVTELVDSIDEQVDGIIGTKYTLTPDTQIFDLEVATCELLTENLPLSSVESIYVNTGTPSSPIWTTEVTDYYIRDNLIVFPNRAYSGHRKLQVNYTYGFDGPTQNIQDLATLLVVKKIQKSEDTSNNQFERTRIGPIDTTRSIGASRFINLDAEINELKRQVGSFKKINK